MSPVLMLESVVVSYYLKTEKLNNKIKKASIDTDHPRSSVTK